MPDDCTGLPYVASPRMRGLDGHHSIRAKGRADPFLAGREQGTGRVMGDGRGRGMIAVMGASGNVGGKVTDLLPAALPTLTLL
jgi:hypothetical protein